MNILIATIILVSALAVGYHLVSKQLEVIHDLVNSNLTKVKADLEVALSRIETLETLLTQEKSN